MHSLNNLNHLLKGSLEQNQTITNWLEFNSLESYPFQGGYNWRIIYPYNPSQNGVFEREKYTHFGD